MAIEAAAPEDPRVTRSRTAILAAAHDHFVHHGYLGANVDLIATGAGVSKRTVYNIYGDKETLFRAVVERAISIAERFSRELAEGFAGDLEEIAVRLARSVLGPRVVPLRRLLIAEARRFPELSREYYDRAPGLVMRTLATHLSGLPSLAVDDPPLAAEHFAFLALGAPLDRALFEPEAGEPPDPDARALAGVAAFRRAYAVSRRPDDFRALARSTRRRPIRGEHMSTDLNPYLPFGGTARAALEFYHSVFGGELEISTFGDAGFAMPEGVAGPPPESVMHGSLRTPQGFVVMASDSSDASTGEVEGKPAIGLTGDEEPALSAWFAALSEGGVIDVPLEKAPWGDLYGQVTDRYGVRWLVNVSAA